MPDHKYRLGQSVDFLLTGRGTGSGPSACKILRLLSTDGDDPQYRVKCSTESFERVVRESQLANGASERA